MTEKKFVAVVALEVLGSSDPKLQEAAAVLGEWYRDVLLEDSAFRLGSGGTGAAGPSSFVSRQWWCWSVESLGAYGTRLFCGQVGRHGGSREGDMRGRKEIEEGVSWLWRHC